MATYIQLKTQIEKLQREAETLRSRERTETIARIKKAIDAFELTAEDLGLSPSVLGRPGKKKAKAIRRHGRTAKKVINSVHQGERASNESMSRKPKTESDKRSVVAPKYSDLASGSTWSGRGKQPKWLTDAIQSGRKLEDFKI